jgi:peptidylprolyl isomerase
MTLSHLRPAVLLSCLAAIVTTAAIRVDTGQQAPAQQAPPAAPIVRPIPAPADVASPPADAVKTKTGLATMVITPGTGTEHPKADDMVTVHYTGWSTKGVMFDSSYTRGKPSTFGVNRVIVGWGETVQLMVAGEKRRAWIPEELAYKGRPDRPQGMLVFDIELISFAPNPASAPADVAAAPADAQKTRSGLAYKVLAPGAGSVHPRRNGTVTVHYTGWTTDGKMFDSSVTRGQPASFPLDQVVPGWTEGLQLMVEGEKTRFWIPEKLAYDGMEGKPKGMLVFDVELITIQK